MRNILLILSGLLIFLEVNAINVDSLTSAIRNLADTTQIKILTKKSQQLLYSNPQESKEIATKLFEIATKSEDNMQKVESLILIAFCDKNLRNFEKSIITLKKALKIDIKVNPSTRKGYILNLIGVNYSLNHQIDSALYYYLESEIFLEEALKTNADNKKAKILKCILYTNIGLFYHTKVIDLEQSNAYFREVLELASEIKDTVRINAAYANLGMVFKAEKQYEKALEYYQKALKMAKLTNNMNYAAKISNNIGGLFLDQNDLKNAVIHFNNSIKTFELLKDTFSIARTYRVLGESYMKFNNFKESIKNYKIAFSFYRNKDFIKEKQKIYLNLSEVFEKTGVLDSSLHYFKKQAELEKQIEEKVNTENFNKLLVSYETEKKEREIEVLKFEKKNQNSVQNFLILSMAFLMVVLFFVIVNFWQRRKYLSQKRISAEKETENFKNRLEFRNKELTTNAIHLVNLNNLSQTIILKIKECLLHIDKTGAQKLKEIIKEIEFNIQQDAWNEFETRFEKVHNDFYVKLDKKHSGLTPTEIKTCAFLRLNMSSKEVALLTNKSVRTVEKLRANIRKKMRLNTETNLVNYLMKF
ncbi:MAG: tetratricopeptide repeat protein [Bacteroidetes bacterium]|jgi:tetratricopeptide (TPR) repeat protein/DNA-binding CsgD family transcriptional regulator|nr:tetratricopeptide repeat protein [Bacteroidota bacterium]MBT6686749.1 tetratricopeptide repeat protein [Bacteroidota bacterium]MBT7145205.1 tetratricopeptide repeat protein [Bacteroidota bacterium]MBT7492970.1 tetratricopeptide repeat protein [Bacteroidota bacterium]